MATRFSNYFQNYYAKKLCQLWFLLILVSCSTYNMVLQNSLKQNRGIDFQFPEEIKIPGSDSKYTDEDVSKVIAHIESTKDESSKIFLLRDLFIKGNDLKERDEAVKAAFVFKVLIHFFPEDFLVNKDLIVSLIRSASFEEAEKFLKASIDKNFQQKSSFMLILAGLYSATGRDKESVKTYNEVLKIDKSNEEACIFLAKNLSSNGNSKNAITKLKSCISHNPKNPIFYYYIGKIYLVDNKRGLSDKYFKKALKVDSLYYQAALGRGLLKEESEDYKGAIQVYKSYLERDEENIVILNRLVQSLFIIEDFENIIPYVEELIRQDNSNVNLKVKLGILYTEKKEYEKAINIFEKVLIVAPNSDKILYYLGALYQQIEKFDTAIVYYSKIDNNSDLFFDSNLQISKLLRGLVSSISEKEYFKKIQKIKSATGSISKEEQEKLSNSLTFSEAYYYSHHKKYNLAVGAMEKLKSLDINQKYFLANLFDKVKRYKDAIALMMGVIEENPRNAHALNFVGYLILETESDFDKAYSLIKKAIEIEPDDAYIRDSLGWYFFKVGDFSKALVEIKKAWSSQKSDVIITKHLALVYQKLNNDLEAQKYFVEALKNCKEENQRREILEVMEQRIVERLPASIFGD